MKVVICVRDYWFTQSSSLVTMDSTITVSMVKDPLISPVLEMDDVNGLKVHRLCRLGEFVHMEIKLHRREKTNDWVVSFDHCLKDALKIAFWGVWLHRCRQR